MIRAGVFLWSEIVLLWAVVNYLVRDPMNHPDDEQEVRFWKRTTGWYFFVTLRAILALTATWLISRSAALALCVLVGSIALPLLRVRIPPKYSAELEIAATIAFLFVSWKIITALRLRAVWGILATPLDEPRTIAGMFVAAAAVFVVHGGTFIVRGILDKSGTLPEIEKQEAGSVRTVDVKEFNRGRLIGALERLLLLAVVIAGSYEALAFLVAAKGLIRSKDLEDRAWAEYFLVGSLASVLVALAAGLGAQYAVKMFW